MPPAEPDDSEAKEAEEQKKLLTVHELNVTLAVFSAEVDVRLDERMKKELLRATKKNPPTTMKYELIYVCNGFRQVVYINDDVSFRLGRTSMTQVRRNTSTVQKGLEVSFRVSVQI